MRNIEVVIRFLKIPAFFIFFSYLVLCACYNLAGADYFFHLKAGEYISSQKTIPNHDVFSFTLQGKAWVNHEWLYQLLIYRFYQTFGLQGIFLLRIAIFSLAFFILTLMVLKAHWVFGFPLLAYGLQLSLRRFTVRPDNFSFLFLIIFLLPFIFKKKNLLWPLIFIQLLWVNIHGFFFLGPLVVAFYLILSRFNKVREEESFYHTAKMVFLCVVLACFFTPHPLSTIIYPLTVVKDIVLGKQALFYKYIQELESPLQHIWQQPQFFGYIIFALISLCFFKNTNWFYLGLGVMLLVFSLNSLRNMYFFIPAAIAIFVDRFPIIKDIILRKIMRPQGFVLLEIFFLFYAAALSVPMFKKVKDFPKLSQAYITKEGELKKASLFFSRDPLEYPQDLFDFIRSHKLPPKMFNSFNVGAMMIFNFFPERKVFIDGRCELYGKEFFNQYQEINSAQEAALDKVLETYQPEGFILSYFRDGPAPLIKLLKKKGFECVYFDQKGMIFVSSAFLEKNPELAQEKIDFSSLKVKKLDLLEEVKFEKPFLKGYFDMAEILYRLDYPKKSQEYLREILRISPSHPDSYYLLALIDYDQKKYKQAFAHCRRSLLSNPSDKAHKLLAKIYLKTGNKAGARKIAKQLKLDFNRLKEEGGNE